MSTEAIAVLVMFMIRIAIPVAVLFALGARVSAPGAVSSR
jgi:hypothetical protein